MPRTYPIPGGEAAFTDRDDLTQRQQRAIARASRAIDKQALKQLPDPPEPGTEQDAAELDPLDDPDTDLTGLPVGLAQDAVDAMWAFNDVLIDVLLESWTIDRPLPATVDEVADLPGKLYEALQKAVDQIQREDAEHAKKHGFTVDAIEDPASPTEASGS